MRSILMLIVDVLQIYSWIVIIGAVLSWLIQFNVVNVRNDVVRAIVTAIYALTEPVLDRIRRFLPNLGGIDVSPIVLILAIQLVINLIYEYGLRRPF
jgi:YggT family protein